VSASAEKIEAIYQLRDSAAAKAKLEVAVAENPTPEVRDALLDATLDVEAKTQHAIEVCHECGHAHPGPAHVERGADNVIRVSFANSTVADGDAV
jgi:hypothetical protein